MKILILEDDQKMPDGHYIGYWIKQLKAEGGHEFKYIFNAYNSGREIAKLLPWADTLAFSSTFYYLHKIYGLTQLIAKVVKKPLTVIIDNDKATKYIGELLDIAGKKLVIDEEQEYEENGNNEALYMEVQDQTLRDKFAYSLRYLKMFQLDIYGTSPLVPITILDESITRVQLQMDILAAYMASRHDEKAKTGRKVKILNVQAVGSLFVNLKSNMIVDEIDMSEVDERPERGVWVMGKGEPVKLLNDHPYNEFELVVENENDNDLAEELCKKCSVELTRKNIMGVTGILRLIELNTMDKANLICEILRISKRGNRTVIFHRLNQLKTITV